MLTIDRFFEITDLPYARIAKCLGKSRQAICNKKGTDHCFRDGEAIALFVRFRDEINTDALHELYTLASKGWDEDTKKSVASILFPKHDNIKLFSDLLSDFSCLVLSTRSVGLIIENPSFFNLLKELISYVEDCNHALTILYQNGNQESLKSLLAPESDKINFEHSSMIFPALPCIFSKAIGKIPSISTALILEGSIHDVSDMANLDLAISTVPAPILLKLRPQN